MCMNYRNKISLCNQKLKIYVSFKIKNNISLTTHFLKGPSSSRHFRIFIQITCRKTRIFMQNPIVLCIYLARQFQESNAVSQKKSPWQFAKILPTKCSNLRQESYFTKYPSVFFYLSCSSERPFST